MAEPLIMRVSVLTKLINKIGGLNLALFVIFCILAIYFSASTNFIDTTTLVNKTDALNNTVQVMSIYSYPYKNYIVQERPFEQENIKIPKNNFEIGKALLLIALFATFMIINLAKKSLGNVLLISEIEKRSVDYLNEEVKKKKIMEWNTPMRAFLREKQVGDNEKLAESWFVPAEVVNMEGVPEYHVLGFNPYTGALKADLTMDEEFKGTDTCPGCGGKICHEKIIDATGYLAWKEMFSPRVR
jgi:hypothetical protein